MKAIILFALVLCFLFTFAVSPAQAAEITIQFNGTLRHIWCFCFKNYEQSWKTDAHYELWRFITHTYVGVNGVLQEKDPEEQAAKKTLGTDLSALYIGTWLVVARYCRAWYKKTLLVCLTLAISLFFSAEICIF